MNRVLTILNEAEKGERRFMVKTPHDCLHEKLVCMRKLMEAIAKELPQTEKPCQGEAPFDCATATALLALGIFAMRSVQTNHYGCDPITVAEHAAEELVVALELMTGKSW